MKKNIFVLVMMSALAAPAFADNSGSAYGALDYGTLTLSNSTIPNTNAAAFDNPKALRFAAGYHFSPEFAIEAGYAKIGNSTIAYSNATTTLETSLTQISAVGTYAVNDSFDVFGKLGVALISMNLSGTGAAAKWGSNNSTSNLLLGIGVQYNISKQTGIRAQYENLGNTNVVVNLTKPATMSVDAGLATLGVVYNF
jgi:OOP family OmpA-OmpF porin